MSDLSLMNDVSMVELRVLSVVGLLFTAVITTVLTMLVVSGGAALGRLVQRARDRYRATAEGTTASASSGPRSNVLVPNGHREVRARQARP